MTAATVTAGGRSPGASGTSLARASALRRSARDSGCRSVARRRRGGGRLRRRGRRGRSRLGLGGARRSSAACGYGVPTPASSAHEGGAQRSRRRLGVGGLGDRAHDDHAAALPRPRPRRRCRGRCRRWRTTGSGACVGRVAHELEPDRRAARLGRRRVDRADRDVVDVRARGGDLLGANGWSARRCGRRRPPRARPRPGASSWPTCTPSASAARDQVGAVVEHEQRAGVGGRAPERGGGGEDPVVVDVLVAQLHHVDAARQRRAQERLRAAVADEVEAGSGQALATIAHDCRV